VAPPNAAVYRWNRWCGCRDNRVILGTSPVRSVRLVGAGSRGKQWTADPDSDPITELAAELPDDWSYVRVEIEDEVGKPAWTNSLFVP
jgi:hypothetical protein